MQNNLLTLADVELKNKRVLIREDFNVPIENGRVQNDLRIRAALPGIKLALAGNASVQLLSHLGRPEAGKWDPQYSLQPIAEKLQQLLDMPVTFVAKGLESTPTPGSVTLYENVRFLPGEIEDSAVLAQDFARLCDIFVMDAFGSAHRAHASTVGVIEFAPIAVAGPLLIQEVNALDRIMLQPQHPVIAIIGGAKISSKLAALFSLVEKVDTLIIGGGMANTFLAAQGYQVGSSLYEPDLMPQALLLLEKAQQQKCAIILPQDVIVEDGMQKDIRDVGDSDRILDIGTRSILQAVSLIKDAKTILWNGPVGIFQDPKFANGTRDIALAIAASGAFSVAGGGETLAAIEKFNVSDSISYLSTGGGAFLEYLEGKSLPAITALINKNREQHA